jgi:hypothetical protein
MYVIVPEHGLDVSDTGGKTVQTGWASSPKSKISNAYDLGLKTEILGPCHPSLTRSTAAATSFIVPQGARLKSSVQLDWPMSPGTSVSTPST